MVIFGLLIGFYILTRMLELSFKVDMPIIVKIFSWITIVIAVIFIWYAVSAGMMLSGGMSKFRM